MFQVFKICAPIHGESEFISWLTVGLRVQSQSAGDYFTDVLFFHRCFCVLIVHCMSGASYGDGGGKIIKKLN